MFENIRAVGRKLDVQSLVESSLNHRVLPRENTRRRLRQSRAPAQGGGKKGDGEKPGSHSKAVSLDLSVHIAGAGIHARR